jgi:NAD(P)-dependent dehydrogenase (short-subunit alcohol dehydrogenase family)
VDETMTPTHRAALARLRGAWSRMDGRTVLVTGATRGIGLETAVRLAALGADVLVHGRDPGRGTAALAAVQAASATTASPALHLADLSSLAGVRGLAAAVLEDNPRLDVLVANAGVYVPERVETTDGLEQTFAVNVVAPVVCWRPGSCRRCGPLRRRASSS